MANLYEDDCIRLQGIMSDEATVRMLRSKFADEWGVTEK